MIMALLYDKSTSFSVRKDTASKVKSLCFRPGSSAIPLYVIFFSEASRKLSILRVSGYSNNA